MSHSMTAVDEIVVKLMVELISALSLVAGKLKKRRSRESFLALVCCYLTQHDAVKWIRNFFGVKDVNAARQKLERLLQKEDLVVGAQTLRLVDGERISSGRNPPSIKYPSTPRQQSNPQYV